MGALSRGGRLPRWGVPKAPKQSLPRWAKRESFVGSHGERVQPLCRCAARGGERESRGTWTPSLPRARAIGEGVYPPGKPLPPPPAHLEVPACPATPGPLPCPSLISASLPCPPPSTFSAQTPPPKPLWPLHAAFPPSLVAVSLSFLTSIFDQVCPCLQGLLYT
jgi:hypothetical protein